MKIETISNRVRIERLRKGYTQVDLARRAGVSKGRVETIENNRCADMGFGTICSILKALDLHVKLERKE